MVHQNGREVHEAPYLPGKLLTASGCNLQGCSTGKLPMLQYISLLPMQATNVKFNSVVTNNEFKTENVRVVGREERPAGMRKGQERALGVSLIRV